MIRAYIQLLITLFAGKSIIVERKGMVYAMINTNNKMKECQNTNKTTIENVKKNKERVYRRKVMKDLVSKANKRIE
jgi:hypothetical protein